MREGKRESQTKRAALKAALKMLALDKREASRLLVRPSER
jgi:hypothetical protein